MYVVKLEFERSKYLYEHPWRSPEELWLALVVVVVCW